MRCEDYCIFISIRPSQSTVLLEKWEMTQVQQRETRSSAVEGNEPTMAPVCTQSICMGPNMVTGAALGFTVREVILAPVSSIRAWFYLYDG